MRNKEYYKFFYAFGITWLVASFIVPLYNLSMIVLVFLISLVAAIIFYLLTAKMNRKTIKSISIKKTGVTEIDYALSKGNEFMEHIAYSFDSISDPEVKGTLKNIHDLTKQIFSFLSQNHECYRNINSLVEYYFPTVEKLVDNYLEINKQPIKTENMLEIIVKIKLTLKELTAVFNNKLDDLYDNKALDITTDIKVLETILAKEGLSDFSKK